MAAKNRNNAFVGVVQVVKDSLRVTKNHPEILVYPYAALFFISVTFPIMSASIFGHFYSRIFSHTGAVVPGRTAAIIGLVGFSAFYTALATAYFTCAVSAAVLSKLEGRQTPPFYGIVRVMRNFGRVTEFAILSLFFFPVGILAQRRKLPRGIIGVMGSSLTLHMAQVAPAILSTDKNFTATLRDSIETLGRKWREGLILKIGIYFIIFLIVVLPKLIQHGFFKSPSASNVSWLVSIELATSSFVTLKVINSIFTTVLYYQASKNKT